MTPDRRPRRAAATGRVVAVFSAALLLSCAAPASAAVRAPGWAAPPRPGGAVPVAAGEQRRPGMPPLPAPQAGQAGCVPVSAVRARKQDWARRRLDLDKIRAYGTGDGVTVAVIDTGVATRAAGLRGRVTAGDGADRDCPGHGTFVAGLVAGAAGGSPDLGGVAPHAEVLGLRGTDDLGRPDAARIASAVRAATSAGADVITVSPALPQRDADLSAAVAAARRAGAVVVAAAAPDPPAGAADPAPSRRYWPASEPGVLSVVDMQPSGDRPDGALPTPDADLAAPGTGVVSGGPCGQGSYLGSGPSLAAAFVAGTAAVVRGAHPRASADEVVRRLLSTAYPANVAQLDAYAAVTGVPDTAAHSPRPEDPGPVRLRDTAVADRATRRATWLALGGAAGVVAVAWAAFALPRARARRWRPAGQD
ncbi:S8 family serine peptidase [Streptomyces mexicanus]|uniref:S8 family serine peptidase n=1 Tax=Streptomyces mexicanus TaxID=178566 RepID=UPI001F32DA92|nr:S8 family serine peptidase [Streptomyces mexicanus]